MVAITLGAVGWMLKRPKRNNSRYRGTTVEDMLDSYQEYLQQSLPAILNRFKKTRQLDRESAVAEAIVFGMLQGLGVDPQINDDSPMGGADFLCCASRGPLVNRTPSNQFMVEATSLSRDAVTGQSGIADEVPDEITGGAFGLLTKLILKKIWNKEAQLNSYAMPTVLAIVSSHFASPVLFSAYAAKIALVSGPHWRQKINSQEVDTTQYTDLQQSIFFKPGPNNTIFPCRKGISAVLLISVLGDKSEVWGILHPEANNPLSPTFLPNVPFVRVAKWPVENG